MSIPNSASVVLPCLVLTAVAMLLWHLRPDRRRAQGRKWISFLAEKAPGAVIGMDVTGKLIYANEAAYGLCRQLGLSVASPRGLLPGDIAHCLAEMGNGLDDSIEIEHRVEGNALSCTIRHLPELHIFDIQIANVSRRKLIEEQLLGQASTDPLTGLGSRTKLYDDLKNEILHSEQTGGRFDLLVLDLDKFRNVNNSMGHAEGDKLLRQVGSRLMECRGMGSKMAWRTGGDEFALLVRRTQHMSGEHFVRSIFDAFSRPFAVSGTQIAISPSIGIASFPEDGQDPDVLLQQADIAMYEAKRQGRNSFVQFRNTFGGRAIDRLADENLLRQAIEQRAYTLHYQPQIDPATGSITGAEALLRWNKTASLSLPVAESIMLAEEIGLIRVLGAEVLHAACVQAKRWHDAHKTRLRIAVNVSARQFESPDFLNTVKAALDKSGIDPALLELELTETAAMRDASYTCTVFGKLKEMGVQIAIDDFGTGYSSLSYLHRLPVDRLKIDKSFVKDMPGGAGSLIAKAIINLGHNLGLKVVAEGVETRDALQFLAGERCDEVQGYYFYKPLSVSQFEDRLALGTLFCAGAHRTPAAKSDGESKSRTAPEADPALFPSRAHLASFHTS
jgi:diguanylate cyclase (GGDEF)-like protein